MMSTPDNIFARNMTFAGGLQYDLERVHGTGVADTLMKISDNLMIDAQSLSVCLRATAAFHEDEAKLLLANVPQRAKSINEFTLLITTMGTGKSLIFAKIMEMQQLKRQYDLKIQQGLAVEGGALVDKNINYRHAILNEITGPGLTKYLDSAGNILVLIDEFDGDHQKVGLFCPETKSNNTNSSAASVLKSFHTGMPFYQKGKVSDTGHIKNPQVSFLAASNGAPVMDILRAKMKSSVMPDAMVMRTIFDVIDSPPKFNSSFKNKFLAPDCIGLEILLLASSLVCNQTYQFDIDGAESADNILQDHQDMCFASSARWKNVDRWIAGRFAKTSELTARLAAQLAHIDITYNLLQDFLLQNKLTNANGPVSFNTYCAMMKFFHEKFPPYHEKPIIISSNQVEAAIYVTKIILLKFFNLFNINIQTANPMNEIPWIPPPSNGYSNPAVVQIPGTQGSGAAEAADVSVFDLYKTILNFPSICFTFTQVVHKYGKLKYRYNSVESFLDELIEMKLLRKVKDGLRSGRNICDLYIKSLPNSITLNTVNTFITEHLDPIKIPWTLYKASCERVLLPSLTSVLSQEVQKIFNENNYLKIIEGYETDTPKPRQTKKSSASRNQRRQHSNDNNNMELFLNRNTSSSSSSISENVLQNDIEEENDEQQGQQSERRISRVTSCSLSTSNNHTSSVVINPSLFEPSSSPSSINSLLPRPPTQILRSSNINNIDPLFTEVVPNTHIGSDNLPVNNEESERTVVSLSEINKQSQLSEETQIGEEIQMNFRRSTRPRSKNKRLLSLESIERASATTSKKKTKKLKN